MKKTILLALFALCSLPLLAQIKVVSVSPQNGAVGVSQDSIVITFNMPVAIDTDNPEESGFFFIIEPEDSVVFEGMSLSEDQLTVTIHGQLAADTDYMALVGGVQGANGETLESPYVFTFTTADETGPYTVKGTLDPLTLAKLKATSQSYNGFAVILSNVPIDFGFEMEGDGEDSEEEEEDFMPIYAALADTTTGEFSISGVREGTYYPVSLNIFQAMESEEDVYPDMFIYDPDEDLQINSIVVDESTTTSNTISDVNLRYVNFYPITFSQAVEIVKSAIDKLGTEAEIVGGETSYTDYFYSYYDMGEGEGDSSSQFAKLKTPVARITKSYHNGAPLNPSKTIAKNSFAASDNMLDGKNVIWMFFAYEAESDSALAFAAMPMAAILINKLGIEDVDIGEGVSFADIAPLPDTFIDSDAAIAIAEAKGGSEFRARFTAPLESGYSEWYLRLSNMHEFWHYTPDPTPSAPQFWKAHYQGFINDVGNETYTEDSLIIFIDLQSGDVLLPTSNEISSNLPLGIRLEQNYPNPFNPSTNIPFTLPQAAHVNLSVYNLLGQKVTTLANELYAAGSHNIKWDASAMSSGVYFYTLEANGMSLTRKLLLIK